MNGNDRFLNINDAHLRVTGGNVHASSFNLDQISITTTSTTASTIDFLNETTAFTARSNIEVGTANLFVNTETSNVGIGTDAPEYTLDVHGTANVSVLTASSNVGVGTFSPEYTLDVHGPANVSVLTASSNVGVGTFSPEYALDVHGTANVGALTATTFSGIGTSLTALNAGNITSGTLDAAHVPSLDASKITGGTLPVSRGGTGTTSSTGSGALVLQNAPSFTGDATFDTDTLKIDAINNRVGIGTTNPGAELAVVSAGKEFTDMHIQSNLAFDNTNWIRSKSRIFFRGNPSFTTIDNGNRYGAYIQGGFRDGYNGGQNWSNSVLSFFTKVDPGNDVEAMTITNGGNVGIGESSPAELVHIRGTGPHMLIEGASNENGQIDFSSGPSYRSSRHQIESRHYALSGNGYRNWLAFRVNEGGESTPTTRMVIRGDGRVGIGTDSPGALLDILGPADEGQHKLILRDANNTNLTFRLGLKAGSSGYQTGWTTIDPNSGGGLAIYDVLYVSGTLSVTSTKNFLIDHPLQPTTKKLIHTAVESPRVDLIYRGTTQLKDGRAIVNIDRQCVGDESCAMEDGTFEALCRDPVYYLQNTTDFNRLIGTIDKNLLTIISEDVNSIAIVNWMVVAERKDRDIVEATQTNDNGRLNTEIVDTSERVNRDGSVRYSSA